MIRLVRITGMLMIAAGVVVVGLWAIKPLRAVWPWLMNLAAYCSVPMVKSSVVRLPQLQMQPL